MKYQFITDDLTLRQVCEQARQKNAVALDTEFIRTKTLYPQLGLVQLFDGDSLCLIDPLSCNNFTPLIELLSDSRVIKVVHACSEDLEAIKRAFDCYPKPIFDTQIGAGFLGLGETLGYASLVNETLGIELDKSESRTDWLQRPLTEQQLSYAAADVYYLLDVYQLLEPQLQAASRFCWVLQETELLVGKKSSVTEHQHIYLELKNSWQLTSRELAVLRELAAWRQLQAEQHDIALNFVVKEVNLISLAKRKPSSLKSLANIPGLTPKEVRRYGKQLLQCIEDGKAVSEQDCPAPIPVLAKFPAYKKSMAELKRKVAELAEVHQLSPQMLASKKQLHQYLKWRWQFKHQDENLRFPDVLSGWRKMILEAEFNGLALPNLK